MKIIMSIVLLALSVNAIANPQIEQLEAFDAWLSGAFHQDKLIHAQQIEQLGTVLKKETSKVDIGHSEHTLEAVVYHFSGLELHALVESTEHRKAYISSIYIHTSALPLSNGLKVGDPESRLDLLDKQLKADNNKYCGMNNCLQIFLENDLISKLVLELYVD